MLTERARNEATVPPDDAHGGWPGRPDGPVADALGSLS